MEVPGDIPKKNVVNEEEKGTPVSRAVIIHRKYLEKFGYTPGCSKCNSIQSGDNSQPGLAHNPACRKRMEQKMSADPDLRKRVDKAEDRKNQYFSRRLEDEVAVESNKRVRFGAQCEPAASSNQEESPGRSGSGGQSSGEGGQREGVQDQPPDSDGEEADLPLPTQSEM